MNQFNLFQTKEVIFDVPANTFGVSYLDILFEDGITEASELVYTCKLRVPLPFRVRFASKTHIWVHGEQDVLLSFNQYVENPIIARDSLEKKVDLTTQVTIGGSFSKLNKNQVAKLFEISRTESREFSIIARELICHDRYLNSLNRFIVAYRVIANEKLDWNRVQLLDDVWFTTHNPRWILFVQSQRTSDLTYAKQCHCRSWPNPFPNECKFGGELGVLDDDDIYKIARMLSSRTNLVCHEYFCRSHDYFAKTDYKNALLFSVIAVESLVYDYLGWCLEKRHLWWTPKTGRGIS